LKSQIATSSRASCGKRPSVDGDGLLQEGRGNLLQADVEAIVNTVSTVGVMGMTPESACLAADSRGLAHVRARSQRSSTDRG
jgi:hypothetical protein